MIKLIVLQIKLRLLVRLLPTKAKHKHLGDCLVIMPSFMVSHIYGSNLTLILPLSLSTFPKKKKKKILNAEHVRAI